MSDILSSNATSDQYDDDAAFTTTKSNKEQCIMHFAKPVHLSSEQFGENVSWIFLTKNWQLVNTCATKHPTRAFLEVVLSYVGCHDETLDEYILSSGYVTGLRYEMYVDLLWFFLDESAPSEDPGALHVAITYQGRWGEVKSTLFEEIWGARVHWNEYESLLLCYEYSWFVRVHFDLSLRELQLLIVDIMSHLRTWFFDCPLTFTECELDLPSLKIKISKMGIFSFTSSTSYVHVHIVRYTITRDSAPIPKQIFAINNAQYTECTTNENNNNCQRRITIQRHSRNKNFKWQESHHRIGSSHNSYCNEGIISTYEGSNITIFERSIANGNGEHIAREYPNNISYHIKRYEDNAHTSLITYNNNPISIINDNNNGMIMFVGVYSRRERIMLNGIDIDDDISTGSIATLTPSNVVLHFICLHRDEHIGITSVNNNSMHRLTNTMSRCTDNVVGIDNNDNNNISTVDTNCNGTRSTKLLSSSEYGEHDMSVHYTITNDTSTVVSTLLDNTHVYSYNNNIRAIHQSTISFNTEATTRAGNNDVDNNESFTYNTMIYNICKSITSTNYIGLIISQDGEHIPLNDAVSNVVPVLYNESDLTRTTRNVSSLESDDFYQHCKEDDHKDNTHEYGTDRSMYACKNNEIVTMVGNILKCNDSPRKSDGRGVSTEGFKGYASNLIGLKRYLVLAGINGTTTRIAHNS